MTAMFIYVQTAIQRLRDREEGQALVEYALILGLVSIVSIAALTVLGGNIRTILENISSQV
jgi:pilus assembly protein Flp/PilA